LQAVFCKPSPTRKCKFTGKLFIQHSSNALSAATVKH
jgi:hypothetical protein